MELYIEKEFLDNFNKDNNDDSIRERVENIFVGYGSKRVFIDFDKNDFKKIDNENKIFALISNSEPPNPVDDIKTHLFEQSDFKQTLVFMNKDVKWFSEAENKGALCFSFDNYKGKIKDIIDKLHFKIDLSEGFKGWEFLKNFQSIYFNEVLITDGYILSDKSNQKINENIIPILKLLLNDYNNNLKINILTKDLNPLTNSPKHIKEKAIKRSKFLKRIFGNYKTKFCIILDDPVLNKYDFHDRIIQTNFSLTGCGKGFNLNRSKISNSQIESETIFEKYTYNRLNRHRNMHSDYIEKLKKSEALSYKMCPIL